MIMLSRYMQFSKQKLLLFIFIYFGYFIELIYSITRAHQLDVNILPPIASKKDKTLWIGGKNRVFFFFFSLNDPSMDEYIVVVVFSSFAKECFLKQANGQVAKLLFLQLSKL